jgi:hypothetical protein
MGGKIRSIRTFEWQDPANLSGSPLPTNLYKESTQQKSLASQPALLSKAERLTPPSKFEDPVGDMAKPNTLAVEGIAQTLKACGVIVASPEQISQILSLAEKQGVDLEELKSFVTEKCREKLDRSDPVRNAAFFLRCIPDDLPRFRPPPPRVARPAAAKVWIDPYENLLPEGENNE